MNVPVLIIGESGSGKSSSFRNLPADRTVVVNTERKSLPFRNFKDFRNIDIDGVKKMTKLIDELKKSEDYDYVVIDSFTSFHEHALKYATATGDGYSKWDIYANVLYELIQSLKDLKQQVFVTSVPEYLEVGLGDQKGYARAKGKVMRYGAVEKEFAIVLWTHLEEDGDGMVTDYQFKYKPNRHNNSKAPHEMFDGDVPNDCLFVSNAIVEYYG